MNEFELKARLITIENEIKSIRENEKALFEELRKVNGEILELVKTQNQTQIESLKGDAELKDFIKSTASGSGKMSSIKWSAIISGVAGAVSYFIGVIQ